MVGSSTRDWVRGVSQAVGVFSYFITEGGRMNIGMRLGMVLAVFGTLFGFGCLYNRYVARQEDRGHDEGFTAFLVIGGVLVTLVGITVARVALFAGSMPVEPWARMCYLFLLDLGCFGASGLPMTVGSWRRYARRRENGQRVWREGR